MLDMASFKFLSCTTLFQRLVTVLRVQSCGPKASKVPSTLQSQVMAVFNAPNKLKNHAGPSEYFRFALLVVPKGVFSIGADVLAIWHTLPCCDEWPGFKQVGQRSCTAATLAQPCSTNDVWVLQDIDAFNLLAGCLESDYIVANILGGHGHVCLRCKCKSNWVWLGQVILHELLDTKPFRRHDFLLFLLLSSFILILNDPEVATLSEHAAHGHGPSMLKHVCLFVHVYI